MTWWLVAYTQWTPERGQVKHSVHLAGDDKPSILAGARRNGDIPAAAVVTGWWQEDPDPAKWRVTW